ncbi:hypothetical protein amrb99_96470 [Actinomadura sp. RB99]|nr:hypothetical protein [Actinomadura sp. RB99]
MSAARGPRVSQSAPSAGPPTAPDAAPTMPCAAMTRPRRWPGLSSWTRVATVVSRTTAPAAIGSIAAPNSARFGAKPLSSWPAEQIVAVISSSLSGSRVRDAAYTPPRTVPTAKSTDRAP